MVGGGAVQDREKWGSRLGFVMAAAGSAVGLGNIWSFPYLTGKFGGGAFLLIYLACVILVGLPVMLTELIIGRRSEKNPVGAYASLKPGTPWYLAGGMGVAAGFLILSYYSVVAGWVLGYFVESLFGLLSHLETAEDWSLYFDQFAANPYKAVGYHFFFMIICVMIVTQGVRGGIERWSKILMPILFLLLLVLVIRGITLPGSGEGVRFLFWPDFSKLQLETILAALGQACFTLSIGMGAMITYGSYMARDDHLPRATLQVSVMDTCIALLAGLAIFPAVFAIGLQPSEGPGLLFKTLPTVFNHLPGGGLFSTLFFFLVVIAAVTSGISLMEVVTAYLVDERGTGRRKASILLGSTIFVLGIPSALSSGANEFFSHFTERVGGLFGFAAAEAGAGMSFFDLAFHITAVYMLPLGSFLSCIFIAWIWGTRQAEKEVRIGATFPTAALWRILVRFLTPFLVGQVLLFGILQQFSNEAVQRVTDLLMAYLMKMNILLAVAFFIGGAVYLLIRSAGARRSV